jgi:hypothetical protein
MVAARHAAQGRRALHVNQGHERRIVGFHTDEEGHWVAELECGHAQHVRHDPPWQVRPLVVTPEGREKLLGARLQCTRCESAKMP